MLLSSLRSSIRVRLIAAFAGVGLIPLAILGLILQQRIHADLDAAANRDLQQQLDIASTAVEGFIAEHRELLQSLALLPPVTSMDSTQTRPMLVAVGGRHAEFNSLHLTGLDGMNVVRSDEQAMQDFGDREWFKGAVAGKEVAYQTLISRTNGRPSVSMGIPVVGEHGLVGVLLGALDLGKASEVVGSVRIGTRGYAWLVDEQGKVMAHPDTAMVRAQQVLADHPVVARARSGDVATQQIEEGGEQWRAVARTLPQGWVLVAQLPEREAQAVVVAARRQIVLVGLAGALFALVAGFLIARSITRPLGAVVEAANRIAEGDVEQTITYESADELGRLAQAFRDMLLYVRSMAAASAALGRGDLAVTVAPRSERDVLAHSMNEAAASLRGLNAEVAGLVAAARDGQLDRRGDATAFGGAYGELVAGVNATLEAVVTPLGEASRVLARVAERDLTARMTGSYRGEFRAMQESLNTAVENLTTALGDVEAATAQVAAAGDQINEGSQALAEGATEQASSLEEVSASLQEMAAMSVQSAANAREARSLAAATRAQTADGVTSVERLSDAMGRIKSSSDQTAKILKTIDEIAFQTNLLALNAAVEAARAGDAGRGFAVVAEEVRALALRSAEAAKSTATLIEEAVNNAQAGVSLNAEVLAKLGEISEQAERVNAVVAEIAAASEQQAQGVQQVNGAVEQMNGVTQQVAANAEESAAAAEELSSQAAHMRDIVETFQLDRGARPGAAEAPAGAGRDGRRNGHGAQRRVGGPRPAVAAALRSDF